MHYYALIISVNQQIKQIFSQNLFSFFFLFEGGEKRIKILMIEMCEYYSFIINASKNENCGGIGGQNGLVLYCKRGRGKEKKGTSVIRLLKYYFKISCSNYFSFVFLDSPVVNQDVILNNFCPKETRERRLDHQETILHAD